MSIILTDGSVMTDQSYQTYLDIYYQWFNNHIDNNGGEVKYTLLSDLLTKINASSVISKIPDFYAKVANNVMTTRKAKTKAEPKEKTPPKSFLEKTFKDVFSRYKFGRTKGEIGIEIEAEGRNLFTTPIQYWQAVADNSLRAYDGHPPIEYVLREPISRTKVMPALQYLDDQLKSCGSELVMSHRCSVHVHVNVQEMPMLHVINFIALYYLFENVFMEWVGPDRKGNLFCLRAQDAEYQIELLDKAIKFNEWDDALNQTWRYGALNIASLAKHGSLEFRSMKGNVDIYFIDQWIRVLLLLKDYSSKFESPEEISNRFRTLTPEQFFLDVFKESHPSIKSMTKTKDFHSIMWDSYRAMRDICHSIDWSNIPDYMKPGRKNNIWNKVSYDEGIPMQIQVEHDEDEEELG